MKTAKQTADATAEKPPAEETLPTCETCMWCQFNPASGLGECHRRAPIAGDRDPYGAHMRVWASVGADDTCGEYVEPPRGAV